MNNNEVYLKWVSDKTEFYTKNFQTFIISVSVLSIIILLIMLFLKKKGSFVDHNKRFKRNNFIGILFLYIIVVAGLNALFFFAIDYSTFKGNYFKEHKEQLLIEDVIENYNLYGVETKQDNAVFITRNVDLTSSKEYYRYSVKSKEGIEFKNVETNSNSVYFKESEETPRLLVTADRFADDRLFDNRDKKDSLFNEFVEYLPKDDLSNLFGKNNKYPKDKKYIFYVPQYTIESTYNIN